MGLDESYLDFTGHSIKRLEMTQEERTVICNICPECKTENTSRSTKCISCNVELSRLFGFEIEEAVREMRFKVENEIKLTCSAGIGPNRLIAKIASG